MLVSYTHNYPSHRWNSERQSTLMLAPHSQEKDTTIALLRMAMSLSPLQTHEFTQLKQQ